MRLRVSEIFGPTIQGEGPQTGRLSTFLRLAGCNLSCSWCDTPYSWDWSRYDRSAVTALMQPEQVLEALVDKGAQRGRVVVTGGEPLVQAKGLVPLLQLLEKRGIPMDVETNGTRPLGDTFEYWDSIVCSPKVIRSADQPPEASNIDPGILQHGQFKFVVRDEDDLQDVLRWLSTAPEVKPWRVWLMPEGNKPAEQVDRSRMVADWAVQYGFNFSSRLHVLAWADERGR